MSQRGSKKEELRSLCTKPLRRNSWSDASQQMQKIPGHARAKSFCSCRCMTRNSHPPSHGRGLGPYWVGIYIYIRMGVQEGCTKQKDGTIAAQGTYVRRRQQHYPGPKWDPHTGGSIQDTGGSIQDTGGSIQFIQSGSTPRGGRSKLTRGGSIQVTASWIDPPGGSIQIV